MADFAFLHGGWQGSDDTLAALAFQASDGQRRCLVLDGPGCGAQHGRQTSAGGFDAIVDELIFGLEAGG